MISNTTSPTKLLLFALSVAELLSPAVWAQSKRITAQQVVERIQGQVGVPWKSETVDTFKSGDPKIPVTGIAVTMMATLDVLQ